MSGISATGIFVVLLLAQTAFGAEHHRPSEDEPYVGARVDDEESSEESSEDDADQNAPIVNLVGKSNSSIESFGQGSDMEEIQSLRQRISKQESSVEESSGQGGSKQMPYNDFEVFGRADTAKELTRKSLEESDKMIDQIERAEVAETKRSVYRSLTRLRGAATAAFDGVARSQVGNIDQYAATNRYLDSNKIKHLADEEANTEYWAFPKEQASLAAVKKTNPKLWNDILTSDMVERQAAETDEESKKASLLANKVGKSQLFWDNFMTKAAETAAARAAPSNSHAGWHLVDSFLTGAS